MSKRALGWMLAGALGILVACGGRATDVPSADVDAGPTAGDAATDSGTDARAKAACRTVQDCNEEPMTSPPAGVCDGVPGYDGVCICRAGFHIQPDGKCGSAPLPSCTGMGGQCMQGATKCPAGTVPGSDAANTSCGDLVAAACCFEAAQCFGPFPFVCCGPADERICAFCESGYLTCTPPATPGGGCG